jgi:hypothetical protein
MNTRTRTEAVMLPWWHFPICCCSRCPGLKAWNHLAPWRYFREQLLHHEFMTYSWDHKSCGGPSWFLDEHDMIRIQEQSQLLSHSSIISFSGRLSRSSSGRKANLQHWWHCQSFWRVAPPSHHPHPTNMTWIVAGRHHVSHKPCGVSYYTELSLETLRWTPDS